MATVRCFDEDGKAIPVAPEAITFSPAVYGVFLENNQVLLIPHPRTKRWVLPGGLLTATNTPPQAVRYHFREITGITPVLGPMVYLEERYIIDNDRRAWHLTAVYYALSRPPLNATTLAEIENNQNFSFVPLTNITRHNMQFGYDAIQACKIHLGLTEQPPLSMPQNPT